MTLYANRRTYALSDAQRKSLVRRYKDGENSAYLATVFGVHPDYVRVAGRRAGVIRKLNQLKAARP